MTARPEAGSRLAALEAVAEAARKIMYETMHFPLGIPPGWRGKFAPLCEAIAALDAVPPDDGWRPKPQETWAEEIARLQLEIGERQMRLQRLVCGDPSVRVTVPTDCACPRGDGPTCIRKGCPRRAVLSKGSEL